MPHSLYISGTPDEVKNSKGLHLVTHNTQNGQKVQILLEELKDKYGLHNIFTNEQKKEWFLRLNPNGRIPVLVDNNQSPPFPVFETSAILLYLVRNYDPDYHFRFRDELQLSQANQWLFFWHGSGAPYQGNKGFFSRAAEKLPFAIARFHNETLRVYGVLEIQLSGKFTGLERDYLAGDGKGKYSVADIGTWSWVNRWRLSGFSEEELGQFPHLLKWIDRVAAREAVQRGIGAAYQLKE
ncbi:hypothetical protein V495_00064 [Pseudogymnoascus sp. VKM F-4514 (FW-929)]|nr:hypothetical protein V495_00064 [Pseudogymnoascus sp. VKM F-4514 (FW-929)]KFY67985.1 hypothetical protein V497_00120 [Pseudogymnoascus sp. VKM F-4516 (FW-969)]